MQVYMFLIKKKILFKMIDPIHYLCYRKESYGGRTMLQWWYQMVKQ